jgi:hypothetical protein
VVHIVSIDIPLGRAGEVDLDGVVVEVARAAPRSVADGLEAGVGDVEGFAVGGEDYSIGVVEGVFNDGDLACAGAEAVGG